MNTLIHIFQKNRAALWSAVIFVLITGGIMLDSGSCLKTPLARRGIVSLELTFKQQKAEAIRKQWSEAQCLNGKINPSNEEVSSSGGTPAPVIDSAILNTWQDFAFILAYTLLLSILVIRKDVPTVNGGLSASTKWFLSAAIAGGLLDVFENIQILMFLGGGDVASVMFALPALLKFICLAISAGYILSKSMRALSRFFERFMRTLWKNRVSVIGFVLLYVALWKADQGQDLLLNLNAHDLGPGFLYFVLTILGGLNWYLPKYYNEEHIKRNLNKRGLKNLISNPPQLPGGYETNVPRIMGVLTFLIPACGILNALQRMSIVYILDFIHPMLLLLIAAAAFIRMAHTNFLERMFRKLYPRKMGWLFIAAIYLMIVVILVFGYINEFAPFQLANLSIGLFLMALIFYIATTLRKEPGFYAASGLGWFENQRASTWLIVFTSLSIATFIAASFLPLGLASLSFSRHVTLPVILTAITSYTVFFYSLLIMGKYSNINWAGIVLLLGAVMAVIVDNRFHDIYRIPRERKTTIQTLEGYADNWVLSRQGDITESTKPYPVFIVNTYGGGIRAAAWTSLVVRHLDSLSNGQFQRHVFAYSGASGGTVGAAVMCALRKSRKEKNVSAKEILDFYTNDFLTPVLIGMMGRDIFFSTTGLDAVDDRARLQDQVWESHLAPLDNKYFSRDFSSLWYDPSSKMYDVPLLFANTYHVETGLKAILAPVKLSAWHFPQALDVTSKLDTVGIPLSTASFLSARFPYISPAAKLDADHHFLDGGLKENSGAETAFELYSFFSDHKANRTSSEWALKHPSLQKAYNNIQLYFISLNNTGNHDPKATTKNLVELTAPFTALYNNWVGNTLKADSVLSAHMEGYYFQLRPLKDTICDKGNEFRPVLPLGWQISDFALRRLHESLDYCHHEKDSGVVPTPKKIDSILKLMGDYTNGSDCGQAADDEKMEPVLVGN
jgi:hypothetical protein